MERSEYRQSEVFENPSNTSAWFAGVFEVGATTDIGVSQHTDKYGHVYRKTLPFIEIHSTHQPMLDRLQRTYGGMLKPGFWVKGGRRAAEIVADTQQFSVARKNHAIAMENWLNAQSIEEKIEIAREIDSRTWQQKSNSESYERLLGNPAFVAGILDCRASIALRPARYFQTVTIQVTSKNIALLSAIEEKFGGAVRITHPTGTIVVHGAVKFQTKIDSWAWDALGSSAVKLIERAHDFMLTPPPTGWNYSRAEELQTERENLTTKIGVQVKEELDAFQKDKSAYVSSNDDLAKSYNVSRTKISRILGKALTQEQRVERFKAIGHFARISVDEETIKTIAAEIEKEVLEVQSGYKEKLSYLPEWAIKFGISEKVLIRHIITRLNPDIRAVRKTILKSQITRERNYDYWPKWREENR